jgi:hypothetical protein
MKYVIFALLALSASSSFAADRCKASVDEQSGGLADESSGVREKKSNIIAQIKAGETILDSVKEKRVLRLLERSGTIAYSYSNDAGTWLAIADANSCKILYVTQIEEM